MEVNIYIGQSKCSNCGKSHKKIYEIDKKPYGSSCAKEILGLNLDAPPWLYEIAERFVKKEYDRDTNYFYLGDLVINFFTEVVDTNFNMISSNGESKLWKRPVKITGKMVKVAWQSEINQYIGKRYIELSKKNPSDFGDGDYYEKSYEENIQ